MKHKQCRDSDNICVALKNMPPADHRYHNVKGNEHCCRCGMFWDIRGQHKCKPRMAEKR